MSEELVVKGYGEKQTWQAFKAFNNCAVRSIFNCLSRQ